MIELSPAQEIRDPLVLAYIDRLTRLKRSHLTLRQHRQTARRFETFLSDVGESAATVEPWQVEEFFEMMTDLEPSTRHSHLKRLRAMYRYAHRRGAVLRDPTADVEIERVADEEPVIIDNAELRCYRHRAATDQQWAQFHLLAFAGLRRQEAIDLKWDDLDFLSGTMKVLGKGGKLRLVPIHPVLAEALQDLPEPRVGAVIRPKRSAPRIGNETWDTALRDVTLGAHTAHDFRRTVASSLALNGVSDPLIDKILGWAPRAVGRRYYIKVAGPELQRAILRLYADDPV